MRESSTAWMQDLPEGTILATDRAYVDYGLFEMRTDKKIWFVTRMKKNDVCEVIEDRSVPANRNIHADQLIKFRGLQARGEYVATMRRVVVWDPVMEEEIVLVTNQLEFGASTIAAIYNDRWEIELLFKALKQNLKAKTFEGTSANALRIQIWTALIAMLLLKYLQFKSKLAWALSNLIALLGMNLFTYRDPWSGSTIRLTSGHTSLTLNSLCFHSWTALCQILPTSVGGGVIDRGQFRTERRLPSLSKTCLSRSWTAVNENVVLKSNLTSTLSDNETVTNRQELFRSINAACCLHF